MKKILFTALFLIAGAYAVTFFGNAIFFYVYIFLSCYFVLFLLFVHFLKIILKKIGIEDPRGLRKKIFWPMALVCYSSFISGKNSVIHYVPVWPLKLLGVLVVFFFSVVLAGLIFNTSKQKIPKLVLSLLGSSVLITTLIMGGIFATRRLHISTEDQLQSLPYATWVPVDKKTAQYAGVVKYDKDKAWPGLNLYDSQNLAAAYLMAMQGNVLHTWTSNINEEQGFYHIKMAPNGDLWAIRGDRYVVRLDWDSGVEARIDERAHHEIALPKDGEVSFLALKDTLALYHGLPIFFLDDHLVSYSQDGKKRDDLPIFEIVAPCITSEYLRQYFFKMYSSILRTRVFFKSIKLMLKNKNPFYFDLLHTNSFQIIGRDVPGLCKKGDLLVSVRNIDLIAIVDPAQKKVLWSWGPGEVLQQHHATLLDNNHILLFDNGDPKKRPYSRVIELDPLTKKIVWEYKADPPEKFFSELRGASQRLPNGNTLITESHKGHVFEVTKEGETVWEFYNPEMDEKKENRVTMYRMTRIIDPENYPALSKLR